MSLLRTILVFVLVLPTAAPLPGQAGALSLETLRVSMGDGDSLTAERGMQNVPLIRSDSKSRTIQVAGSGFDAQSLCSELARAIHRDR